MRRAPVLALLLLTGCSLFNLGRRVPAIPAPPPPTAVPTAQPTVVPSLNEGMLFSIRWAAGECNVACAGDLTVLGRTILLTVFPFRDDARSDTGVLTDEGLRAARSLRSRLDRADLRWSYPGCGTACDGVTLALEVGERRTVFPAPVPGKTTPLPGILKEAASFWRDARTALVECRSNALVVPASDCLPRTTRP